MDESHRQGRGRHGSKQRLGLAIVRALIAERARFVAGARTTDSLAGFERVTAMAVDLASKDGPARLVERALAEHGRVDVLVDNVGAVRAPTTLSMAA